ncbi:MAG: hypothetical protein ACYTHK_09865 [Planctomycetota bacterium]|jgi:hypothetical protein
MLFLLGTFIGVFAFAETEHLFADFWYHAGFMGRLTLPEVLGVPAGYVVLAVVVAAIFAFKGAEWLERRFRGVGA